MREIVHNVDFCVIGGGLAGMCAAIAAGRNGIKVALMHDRPVLGGNASSEIRMWVAGAQGKDSRETGIIEEIMLENRYRNPDFNYSIWDSILYEKVRFEPNITLLLNCSCNELQMNGSAIKSVRGWQLTTQTWHRVEAKLFADCSGDSILAPLCGAEYSLGREGRDEFDEDIALEKSDTKTMGQSCLIQARETIKKVDFIPPSWAYKYESCDEFPMRDHGLGNKQNFWWLEFGGEIDGIYDTEEIRDELLKIGFGVWDHIKNYCGDKEKFTNWTIDWIGFLPGKRESRRYVGDHILTQSDVQRGGEFDDIVAYGGWPMDDHHPAGFYYKGDPTTFHPAPSPFGIPYRCLYSKNIENLFFAGRNISYTHAAMSSARVMATCAIIGQAVGTAAAIAVVDELDPRGIYEKKIEKLKQTLTEDDCYLPGYKREISALTLKAGTAAPQGDPEQLRNGTDRSLDGDANCWSADLGESVEYRFGSVEEINKVRIVFDSDLNRLIINKPDGSDEFADGDPAAGSRMEMLCHYPLDFEKNFVPATLVKSFKIEAQSADESWRTVFQGNNNYLRLVKIDLEIKTTALRLTPLSTWGSDKVRVFAWDVK